MTDAERIAELTAERGALMRDLYSARETISGEHVRSVQSKSDLAAAIARAERAEHQLSEAREERRAFGRLNDRIISLLRHDLDAALASYQTLEKERAADEARAQDTIAAARKRAEHAERERDEAKNLLAAANERAEMLESENEELQRHPECGACGMVGTREAVLAHIQDCEKHPLHTLKSRLVTSEARCKALEGALKEACDLAEDAWHARNFHIVPEFWNRLVALRAALAQQGQDARNLDAVGPAREAPSAGQEPKHE